LKYFQLRVLAVVVSLAGLAETASASPEPPGAYDARSLGMAGTGVSYIHNGSSVYHNPAILDGIKDYSATLSVTGAMPMVTAPVNGPQTQLSSDSSVVPLVLIGGGYRLTDQLVVGAAVYPKGGFGSTYSNVAALGGQDLSLRVMLLEASPAVSFSIFDNLSIGLGYRITHARQTRHQPLPTGGASDLSLSGTNFAGVHVGLHYQPSEAWDLGFSYRNKVTTKMKGKTTMNGTDFDTTAHFGVPHTLRLGAAHALLDQKALLLSLDLKYLLYAGSNKQIELTIVTPEGSNTTVTPLNWKNVASASLGAEYRVSPLVAVRAGYFVSGSATPEDHVNPFTPPPGIIHSVHAGAGLSLSPWDLNAGLAYAINGQDVQAAGVVPGHYEANAMFLGISASYHQ
jgi:long-chain fatty acid transport protein